MNPTRFAILALGMVLVAAGAHSSAEVPVMKTVMQAKLLNSQALLKAVVTADFAAIDRAASRLSRISETEIALWQSPGQPEYTQQAMVFLSSVQGLRDAARDRDVSAAGAHYATLVSSCIQCHAFVRRSRVVSLTR